MVIAYSFGVIDYLHYGHIRALREAKAHADLHYYGLIEDEAAQGWMGSLLSNYEERKSVLEQVSCIDHVISQRTLDPVENLKRLHDRYPDAKIVLYYGSAWKTLSAEEYLNSIGGSLVPLPYYEKFRPENILKLLTEESTAPHQHNELLSTKANTLLALKKSLHRSRIEDILIVTGGEYDASPETVLESIALRFGKKQIVLRSSTSNEDCFGSSNAGHYESVLNIFADQHEAVKTAMECVLDSYRKDGLDIDQEQVLIQPQTRNVAYSGVVFTRDVNQNRPYYVINYDDTGATDRVTGGGGGKTLWIAHDFQMNMLPVCWRNLLSAVQEIEELLSDSVLDIEFAIDELNEVVIFQTRPLAACYKFNKAADDEGLLELKNREVKKYARLSNAIDGGVMMLSDMAFWNPAEIIGTNPHNLDYSLYKLIITHRAWNEGLVPMGYYSVPQDLMYRIGNKPYISLEYSFMSLIPSAVEEKLAKRLVAYYRDKLKKDITAHDKIEFEITISCYDFESEKRLEELRGAGFSQSETDSIREAVFELTENALSRYEDTLEADNAALGTLTWEREKIEKTLKGGDVGTKGRIACFSDLLRSICAYGTPQFSRQARYAFICRALCRTLVSRGFFTSEEMDDFMLGVETVATDFDRDFTLFHNGEMTTEQFNRKYGHLRSGTYDIRSMRYDRMSFPTSGDDNASRDKKTRSKERKGALLDEARLKAALDSISLNIPPAVLMRTIRSSFEQRELFKFEFTKSLSLAIELLADIGEELSISRPEMSYLEVSDVLAASNYESTEEIREILLMLSNQRRQTHKRNEAMILPEVITGANDFSVISISEARPNFITNQRVCGELVRLEPGLSEDISGKIVVIEKADPGYDWVFTNNIKGLITKYGGAASHMAIRCAEFGVPAAIGCGSKIFNYVSRLRYACIDCKNEKIEERISL